MDMKTMINIKTDSVLKSRAQRVAMDLGLPLGTIINNYLRTFVVDKQVIFAKPLIPNQSTRKILDEALTDIRSGNTRNFSPAFNDMNEARRWLEKDAV